MNLDDLLLTGEEIDSMWEWLSPSIEEEEECLRAICVAQRDKVLLGILEWLEEVGSYEQLCDLLGVEYEHQL